MHAANNTHAWADALLADDSEANLLIWPIGSKIKTPPPAKACGNAEAHYRALYDAATAYARRKEPWKSFFSTLPRPNSGQNRA
jgi:hypothetical protein